MSDPIHCNDPHLLDSALMGLLSGADQVAFATHLANCPICLERLRKKSAGNSSSEAILQDVSPPAGSRAHMLTKRTNDSNSVRLDRPEDSQNLDQSSVSRLARFQLAELISRFAPPVLPDELGRVGGFRILQVIGRGGMGIVFRAEDVQLGRQVAMKIMLPSVAAQPGSVERFLRESRAAAGIRHEHVVTIYQVGEEAGMHYLTQELLVGETLKDRLTREGKLPLYASLRIGREIALGLAAAHAQGLLHRDIKPSNIWLDERNSRVKILDFGLARFQMGDVELTGSGVILGTPVYMAPEQAAGKQLDGRSDLFSLGCILYQMTTGRLPFPGSDVYAVMHSMVLETPPSPTDVNSDVPPFVSDLIDQLLSKDRENRPANAAEVALTLEFALRSMEATNALSETQSIAFQPHRRTAVELPQLRPEELARQPSKERLVDWILVGGSVLILGGLFVFMFVRGLESNAAKTTEVQRAVELSKAPEQKYETVPTQEAAPAASLNSATASVVGDTKPEVQATVAPQQIMPGTEPIDYAAEHRAAEWVLSMKGGGSLVGEHGRHTVLKAGSLPDKFFMTDVYIANNPQLTDSELDNLAGCRRLRYLGLPGCSAITAEGLKRLKSISSLSVLAVQSTNVGDGIASVIAHWPLLSSLNIAGGTKKGRLSDEGIAALPSLPRLQILNLVGTLVTDAGLQTLVTRCPNLEDIEISGRPRTFVTLKEFRHLQAIGCSGDQLTDHNLVELHELHGLERLRVQNPIRAGDLEHLSRADISLKSLDLLRLNSNDSNPSLKDFASLAQIRGLRDLTLNGRETFPPDEVLQTISEFPNLRSLKLQFAAVKVENIPASVLRFHELRPDIHLVFNERDFSVAMP